MREEEKEGEVRGGLWIPEDFTEEVAGGRHRECLERQVHHPLQCGNPKALKTGGCFMNLLVAKLD